MKAYIKTLFLVFLSTTFAKPSNSIDLNEFKSMQNFVVDAKYIEILINDAIKFIKDNYDVDVTKEDLFQVYFDILDNELKVATTFISTKLPSFRQRISDILLKKNLQVSSGQTKADLYYNLLKDKDIQKIRQELDSIITSQATMRVLIEKIEFIYKRIHSFRAVYCHDKLPYQKWRSNAQEEYSKFLLN